MAMIFVVCDEDELRDIVAWAGRDTAIGTPFTEWLSEIAANFDEGPEFHPVPARFEDELDEVIEDWDEVLYTHRERLNSYVLKSNPRYD